MSGFLIQTVSAFALVLIKMANFSAKTDENLFGKLQTTCDAKKNLAFTKIENVKSRKKRNSCVF